MPLKALSSGKLQIPMVTRSERARQSSFNPETRELEVIWSTGEGVEVQPWMPPHFREPFIEELSLEAGHVRLDWFNSGRAPLLNVHQRWSWTDQLGKVVKGSVRLESGKGLARVLVSGRASLTELRSDLAEMAPNLSIGYEVYAYRDVTMPEDPKRRLLAIDWAPIELSLAPVPADLGAHGRSSEGLKTNECTIEVRSKGAGMDPEEVLVVEGQPEAGAQNGAGGASGAAPAAGGQRARQPVVVTEGGAPATPAAPAAQAPANPPAPAGASPEAVRGREEQARLAERERIATIERLCTQHGVSEAQISVRNVSTGALRTVSLGAWLRSSGASVDRAREVIMEQLSARGGENQTNSRVGVGRSEGESVGAAIENALSHRLRLRERNAEGHLVPIALTDQGREYRNLSLLEIGRDLLGRAGVNHRAMNRDQVASVALSQRAMGTTSFPEAMANVANKVLLESYEGAPSTYQRIGRRRDFTDFKPRKLVKMGNVPQLLLVAEHGEVTFGTMGDGAESIMLKSYGRIASFTREAMINDDLGVLDDIPRDFGEEARQMENVLAWLLVTSNVVLGDGDALYHTNHANLHVAGATGVLSETSLSTARGALRRQTGLPRTDDQGLVVEPGRQLNLAPGLLIVPPELETTARKLLAATNPVAAAGVQTFTEFEGLIIEAQLTDTTAWYVNAARKPLFEYGYLDGNNGPMIDTRLGFTTTGIDIRCLHDFAVGVRDHRPTYKSPGA